MNPSLVALDIEESLLWFGQIVQMDRGSASILMSQKDINHVVVSIDDAN